MNKFILSIILLFSVLEFNVTAQGTPCTASTTECTNIADVCPIQWTVPGNGIVDPACGLPNSGEYWVEFTAGPDGTSVVITGYLGGLPGGTKPMNSIAFQVYSAADCSGPFTYEGCYDNGTGSNNEQETVTTTPGTTYYIRFYDPDGSTICSGGTANLDFGYCLDYVSTCQTCAAPCGTAQGFSTAPTVAEVVAGCTTTPFVPELQASSTNTFCFDFQATNTTVDFNVIITSDCGGNGPQGGNVTNFSWELFDVACGAAVQTGTLASLTFTPVVVNNNYVFCYTFDVPSSCSHSQHCPFFVGATILPVELTDFRAKTIDNSVVELGWKTKSENENDFFTIERSATGVEFEAIGTIDGAGNSTIDINYDFQDINPLSGMSYYRLKQTDFDGTSKYSNTIAVEIESSFADLDLYPNPVKDNSFITFKSNTENNVEVSIYDITGSKVLASKYIVKKGSNKLELQTNSLPKGMYFLTVENEKEISKIKFVKD